LPFELKKELTFDFSTFTCSFHLIEQYVPRIFRLDCKPDLLSDNNTKSSAYNKQFTDRSPALTGSQLPVTKSEKDRKIYFKIKKTIGLNNPCKLLEKLFDSLLDLVTPILLYCSEVWGVI
jgi:hypothetical protein